MLSPNYLNVVSEETYKSLLGAVKAFQEAKKRVPRVFRRGITFFSEHDFYTFDATYDEKLCVVCRGLAYKQQRPSKWRGNIIRFEFPWLEIAGRNRIKAKVHPHCRCELVRITDWREYLEAEVTMSNY